MDLSLLQYVSALEKAANDAKQHTFSAYVFRLLEVTCSNLETETGKRVEDNVCCVCCTALTTRIMPLSSKTQARGRTAFSRMAGHNVPRLVHLCFFCFLYLPGSLRRLCFLCSASPEPVSEVETDTVCGADRVGPPCCSSASAASLPLSLLLEGNSCSAACCNLSPVAGSQIGQHVQRPDMLAAAAGVDSICKPGSLLASWSIELVLG